MLYKLAYTFLTFNLLIGTYKIIITQDVVLASDNIINSIITFICGCILYNKKLVFIHTLLTNIILYNLLTTISVNNIYMAEMHKFILTVLYYYTVFIVCKNTFMVYIVENYFATSNPVEILELLNEYTNKNVSLKFMGLELFSYGKQIITEELLIHNTTSSVEIVECSICLDHKPTPVNVRQLKCNHSFHTMCIDTWILSAGHTTCPLCRTGVI